MRTSADIAWEDLVVTIGAVLVLVIAAGLGLLAGAAMRKDRRGHRGAEGPPHTPPDREGDE